ncbi:hypothetical protein GCM10010435_51710 [Winogradskya consettensis]|uniref:Uncharacterized protein n=1 Tax=Winogradskya consettensis TaxID=113560 RepID=A0A919VMP5_9ACTN|nr:hypothetical protein [Actinoplanes consettensis]GIM71919.1 hypothetical protein Aco04nite_27720 [Actinoplanes consettensis]
MRFFSNDAREASDDQATEDRAADERAADEQSARVQSEPVAVPGQRPPSPWSTPADNAADADNGTRTDSRDETGLDDDPDRTQAHETGTHQTPWGTVGSDSPTERWETPETTDRAVVVEQPSESNTTTYAGSSATADDPDATTALPTGYAGDDTRDKTHDDEVVDVPLDEPDEPTAKFDTDADLKDEGTFKDPEAVDPVTDEPLAPTGDALTSPTDEAFGSTPDNKYDAVSDSDSDSDYDGTTDLADGKHHAADEDDTDVDGVHDTAGTHDVDGVHATDTASVGAHDIDGDGKADEDVTGTAVVADETDKSDEVAGVTDLRNKTDENPTDENPGLDEPIVAEPAHVGTAADDTTPVNDEAVETPAVVPVPVGASTATPAAASTSASAGEPDTFFKAEDAAGLKERWRDVQLRFVDSPKEATEDAAKMVEEAVEKLTASLKARKDGLAGESDDTEALRVQLRGYRDILNRILGL